MSTLLLISIHDGNVIGAQHGHTGKGEPGELQVSYSIYRSEIFGGSKQIEGEREHCTNIHHPPN